jgi:Tol biopolymer transport system component/DNA-binding winged helix-turn-helix (wHTH) protein
MENEVYRFADFLLDPANRRLSRGDAEIYLPPKTFDTLLLLVERHGRLVTKRTLLDRIWADTAVTENTLTQRISELRQALHDDLKEPRFIRTLPRVGFTFIPRVEVIDRGEPAALRDIDSHRGLEPTARVPVSRRRQSFRWFAVVGVAVVVTGGLAVWLRMRPRSAHVTRLELISTFPGSHRWPSFSPDGRMVAFISDAGGTPQVWVKNLAAGDPIQITFGSEPAARPRWSGQGDRIIYSVRERGIWSVPPLGGPPRQIVSAGWNPDLSRDGRRLVFERPWELWTANGDGTNARRLPGFRFGYLQYYGDAWPTFSPDGRSIAVFLGEEGPYGDYWVIPSEGGAPHRLTFDKQQGGAPAWTPDGMFLILTSARTGSLTLWRVPLAGGGVPEALTSGAGEDLDPVVSPDGRTLLFANVKRAWSLVVQNPKTGLRKTLLERRTAVSFPRYSWDGQRIVFMGGHLRGEVHLFVGDTDGSNVTPVTAGASEMNILPQWSGDNSALYFYQRQPTETFRRVRVSGGASQEVAPWSLRREYSAAVDPHDRVALYSLLEQGRLRGSWVRDLKTGRERALPFAMFEQRFSRDGRFIAGESRDHEVLVCEIAGNCRPLTPKSDRGVTGVAWSGDGKRLFFVRFSSTPSWGDLRSIRVEGGREEAHGPIGPFRDYAMFIDVSPRDEIVFAPYQEGPHELWMAKLQ